MTQNHALRVGGFQELPWTVCAQDIENKYSCCCASLSSLRTRLSVCWYPHKPHTVLSLHKKEHRHSHASQGWSIQPAANTTWRCAEDANHDPPAPPKLAVLLGGVFSPHRTRPYTAHKHPPNNNIMPPPQSHHHHHRRAAAVCSGVAGMPTMR